jgi:hypothetical protein
MVSKPKPVPQFPMSLMDAIAALLKGNNAAPRKIRFKPHPSLTKAAARS